MSRLLPPWLTSRAICASWRGELVFGPGRPLASVFAGGQQLDPSPFGERLGAHRGEQVVRGPQLLARVAAAPLTAQPFAKDEMGAGELEAPQCTSSGARWPRGKGSASPSPMSSARAPASSPSASSVPAANTRSASRATAACASSISPLRAAASTRSGSTRVPADGASAFLKMRSARIAALPGNCPGRARARPGRSG